MVSACVRQDKVQCNANVTEDMDKMVSIKGLVIRTTPVIPDMKTGNKDQCSLAASRQLINASILPMSGLQSRSQRFP